MGKEEILQEIEVMSVKDLADLVEMIEERFHVSAAMAAPVAVATAPGGAGSEGGGGEAGAETLKVVLTSPGQKKIQVIKEIKEITGKGLKECKELVDKLPAIVKEGVGADEATSIKEKLEAAGAEVELK